jgi:uncharacterized membrane protein
MTVSAVTLRILVGIHLVWTVLLTPIAFEPRPFSSFTALGFLSLAMIFTTVTLDVVAFVISRRRWRAAGTLVVIGGVLFVPPFAIDQLGLFSTQPAPTTIVVLEIAALVTQLALLYVGWRLRRVPG